MKKKKEGLSKVLLQHLGTDVPVEFIENEYKDLEQCGAWPLLQGNLEKNYSRDLNSKLVWYSNGPKKLAP